MKTVIISGASRGIGAAIAKKLAKDGFFVVINFLSNKNAALAVLEECNNCGMIWQADVSKPDQVEAMVNAVVKKCGSVDALVNNAGISKSGLLIDMTDSDIASLIATNLVGVINCCKYTAKVMLAQHSGKIVNISSMWGEVGASCESVYSATKGGVVALSKSLAKELGYNGINVNCITAGLINTDMNSQLSQEDIKGLVDDTPCGRVGQPTDIANAVSWLVGDEADFVNGHVLAVNGGFVI